MKKTLIIAMLAFIAAAGLAKEKTVVWEQPSTEVNTMIEGYFTTLLEITRVEFDKNETRVMMHVADRPAHWVKFDSHTYLVANGIEYGLKSLDGMELDKETYFTDCGYADLVFHFEPLPMNTRSFDFTEGDFNGAFQLLGIEDAKTRAKLLFPSNWRNMQTGDWEIGFYDQFAIYDCQFWNYKQKQQKADTYMFVLENAGKEIAVNVEKNMNGQRAITIDGKKAIYSFISSIAMPDYPAKDSNTTFKDTHYQTDTVTFVGWLKGMPEWMWEKGREFSVSYENFFSDELNHSYGMIDSLGRFNIKIPLLNTSEMFFDWKRTYIRTPFEPGETYFLLYDFEGGHKLFMGKNCRLQNETLAHPISWGFDYPNERGMEEDAAMMFLESLKADKAKALQELDKVVAAHPNISDRYISYLRGHYNIDEGRNLMQGRYFMKGYKMPADYMSYVSKIWQNKTKPYTLYRDFSCFREDYIKQLVQEHYPLNKSYSVWFRNTEDYQFVLSELHPYLLRKLRDKGRIQMSSEELALIDSYIAYMKANREDSNEEDSIPQQSKEELEYEKKCAAIFTRQDIKQALEEETPLMEHYQMLDVMDSLGLDQDLRDFSITHELYKVLDHDREPLKESVMQFFENNVKMPAAKDFLHAEQEKYLAIERRGITHPDNLKSAENVANMSDGEQILRRLIEPYKGKIILMDIWGTWCGPCKDALSHSQEEYKRLKDYNIVYLYLANNSPDESWKNVIRQYEVSGENVVHYNLPASQQSAIENFLNVHAFPTFKLIDREGTILDVNADPRDLNGLAKLLDKIKK